MVKRGVVYVADLRAQGGGKVSHKTSDLDEAKKAYRAEVAKIDAVRKSLKTQD